MEFKARPRCSGDLFREEDVGHTDLVCLQRGFRQSVELVSVISRPTHERNAFCAYPRIGHTGRGVMFPEGV